MLMFLSLLTLERDVELAVHECGDLIKAALDKLINRYGDCLGKGESGNKLKDAYKKIEFTLREKDDLIGLRRKLSETTARISLLSVLAATHLAGAGTAEILARIDCARKSASSEQDRTNERIEWLVLTGAGAAATLQRIERAQQEISVRQGQAHEQAQALVMSSQVVACLALGIIVLPLRQLAQGVTNIPASLFGWITLDSLRLDSTRGLPVHTEDAMGNPVDLQLHWLHDWRNFDYMLCRRFEELRLAGIEKPKNGRLR
ncbi:hypothetical protein GGTG_12916 [Gaeumannomyces tritici R3-111a-1]|uniref:Fungal N-terminal domain-containing protein n=1 Tax=Gaeumannomyces tritici (strain R3-111a-1) TaxID=644352 RepID=J3PHD7_GAET3|nr:hypothetical protein GGTG_12916 [Gaeumannomyces tritici R3-111a-1]EJT69297.1 hypothetical protein GGTG_12916 [Gaeumannomyces tritici R3-111a-1]